MGGRGTHGPWGRQGWQGLGAGVVQAGREETRGVVVGVGGELCGPAARGAISGPGPWAAVILPGRVGLQGQVETPQHSGRPRNRESALPSREASVVTDGAWGGTAWGPQQRLGPQRGALPGGQEGDRLTRAHGQRESAGCRPPGAAPSTAPGPPAAVLGVTPGSTSQTGRQVSMGRTGAQNLGVSNCLGREEARDGGWPGSASNALPTQAGAGGDPV